jgi:threonine/homoserine/homoserine lactone efflux protein
MFPLSYPRHPMSPQTFTAVSIFALVMAFTPGPNNVMLASSGARFGLARTVPHLIGVMVGFPVMLLLVAIIAAITLAVTLPSTLTWAAFGAAIRHLLRVPMALRLFNLAMALLLFASTVPILVEIWDGLTKA